MCDPESRTIILAGAGHAHLLVLKNWLDQGYQPPEKTLLINSTSQAWYSGMMPGLLAGRYSETECAIELKPLCKKLGIELIIDDVIALDANQHQLKTRQRLFNYQLLSINTGGQPPSPDISKATIAIAPVKPFTRFIQAWQRWQNDPTIQKIAVIGGGAAAFEVSLALSQSLPDKDMLVFCQTWLVQHPASVAQKAREALQQSDVQLHENQSITGIQKDWLMSESQAIYQVDAVVLATGAAPLDWYQTAGLKTDKAGFIQINNHLQSQSHPNVFATGDAASLSGAAHSGVYAVRQGPVLADNLKQHIKNRPLSIYRPQKNALALMALPEQNALMSYFNVSVQGRLMGLWKNYLDTRFVRQFTEK